MATDIVHADHGCADTLREAGNAVQGEVEVQCLSDPGGVVKNKARCL